MYLAFVAVLSCLLLRHCSSGKGEDNDSDCSSLKLWLQTSSVSLVISNKGFHREVVTSVELSPDAFSDVRVLLAYHWPSGVYVDPYQLAFLTDQSDWQILIDSAIDLEVPAHKTSGFVTYVYPSFVEEGQLKVAIPIHGRYHQPSFVGNTFASVTIKSPELLLLSEKCTQLQYLEHISVVNAPCTSENTSMCQWAKIQHQQGRGDMSLQFPVGDGPLITPICSITLLATMICCAVLSRVMWKHRII